MNVKPIPNSLLGDEFYLYVPTESGWSRRLIENVRVERKSAVSSPTAANTRDISEITIWYDYENSYPYEDFSAGMRARYQGEDFEITEVKFYRAQELHHCKIKAVKIG
ncbi:MAG: putative minor capsid protein [Oscillospiraceae bacterium]|nr:putative minor capsid protein [Oscillospiraceae bacterium]